MGKKNVTPHPTGKSTRPVQRVAGISRVNGPSSPTPVRPRRAPASAAEPAPQGTDAITSAASARAEVVNQAPPALPEPTRRQPSWHRAASGLAAAWRRPRLRAALGVAAAVVVAAVLVTVAIVHSRSDTKATATATTGPAAGPPPASATDAARSAARAWIDANVAHGTPISADQALTQRLRDDGFTALPGLPGSHDWHADAFVVTTPDVRRGATGSVAAALAASAPVAVFSQGLTRVEVRKIDPTGAADLASRTATDHRQRLQAGTALLRNRHLHPDNAAQVALAAGALDLRAETVLALLADKADVQLSGVTQQASEAAAGLPVRTLTVSSPNSVALSATVTALPVVYRPLQMTPIAGGAIQLQWDVAIAPVQSLS